VKNLKSRIKRMEKQLSPQSSPEFIMIFSNEEKRLRLEEYKQNNPGKPEPIFVFIKFVRPKGLAAGVQANHGPNYDELPADMGEWDVTLIHIDGKDVPVVITNNGHVTITDEDHQEWRKLQYDAKNEIQEFAAGTKRGDHIGKTSQPIR